MGLVEDLAARYCEKDTSREGCLRPSGYEGDERCDPCKARAELGIALAPRRCERCEALLTEDIDWVSDRWGDPAPVGVTLDGGATCPPLPHRPHLFYLEFTRRPSKVPS